MEESKSYSTEHVKHIFSEKEKKNLAELMAQKVAESTDLDEQKKAVVKDFDGRIQAAKSVFSSCAAKLNSGFEMRRVECAVVKDYEKRVILYIRTDNGEVARERVMTAGELQQSLPLAANE